MGAPGGAPAILGAALVLAGCGATPPQLPTKQANRVASALTGISEACGESYQEGFPQRPAPRTVEAAAAMRALELAKVSVRAPEDVYQSQTLRQIVAQTVDELRECGLPRVASTLQR